MKHHCILKKQLKANKLKFKRTSTEWTLKHILNRCKGENEFLKVTELAKIVNIVSVTNTWLDGGASAVKRAHVAYVLEWS